MTIRLIAVAAALMLFMSAAKALAADPYANLGKPTMTYDAYQFHRYWKCRAWFFGTRNNPTLIKAVCQHAPAPPPRPNA